MSNNQYRRSPEDLRQVASLFWPAELSQKEAELSVIPKLIETQDDFITILSLKFPDLDNLFIALGATTLPANLFLKHLVVLSDTGGEMVDRVNKMFKSLFPTGELKYYWNGEERVYHGMNPWFDTTS
jgi:hypothetical protein